MGEEVAEKILIIDDEEALCRTLDKILSQAGYEVAWRRNSADGLKSLGESSPACLLLDLKLPDIDGISLLSEIKEQYPHVPVIILTAHETVKTAVLAMKNGAFHYLSKPFDNEELKVLVSKAVEQSRLYRQLEELKGRLGEEGGLELQMGSSQKIREVIRSIHSVAPSNLSVLIFGESGSGKELVARSVHRFSKQKNGPFVAVDCAAIPETLIESELFGHERGAFTGAACLQKGKFEISDGGTIFLDEVENIPLGVQAKLLRFLEEHTFQRIGGKQSIRPSVRVVAASNRDLEEATKLSGFRLDLFYRLNEFPIQVPPLRERREDIPFLCSLFLHQYRDDIGKEINEIHPEALDKLLLYSFPGNVRELRNILRRAMILADHRIEMKDLPSEVRLFRNTASLSELHIPLQTGLPLKEAAHEAVVRIERALILEALTRSKQRKGKAAKLLGIDEKTLYNKMKEFDLKG
ncbi:MAG: sigma-54-dependent Fis family transcriptional regulator [Deltaproteobacteria bacterium]|nr:sigma-54-dependent Fis family transcriptional regulator [Deltaproteobacteria bacterium]